MATRRVSLHQSSSATDRKIPQIADAAAVARSTFANPWVFLKGATYNGYAEAWRHSATTSTDGRV